MTGAVPIFRHFPGSCDSKRASNEVSGLITLLRSDFKFINFKIVLVSEHSTLKLSLYQGGLLAATARERECVNRSKTACTNNLQVCPESSKVPLGTPWPCCCYCCCYCKLPSSHQPPISGVMTFGTTTAAESTTNNSGIKNVYAAVWFASHRMVHTRRQTDTCSSDGTRPER